MIPIKLFSISDLHLSFGSNKPMEIFRGWENHTERLFKNWQKIVEKDDVVVLAGDISWSIDFAGAKPDFDFIHSLNGKKIILKGNHDYWWSTANKMRGFLAENNFDDISILHNNFYEFGDYGICGSRGWLYDGSGEKDLKIIKRECGRLEMSLKAACEAGKKPIVFLHYPPVYGEFVCVEIIEVLRRYEVDCVYYGHIHGAGRNHTVSEFEGIKMRLVSCDCVDFTPILVKNRG